VVVEETYTDTYTSSGLLGNMTSDSLTLGSRYVVSKYTQSIFFPFIAGCIICFGDARKSPQCKYRKVLDEPTNVERKVLSPAFMVCCPSNKNKHEPGQWFASMSVTCTPPVSGIIVGVSISNGRIHFLSTESI
jgi:hypothetical protein